MPAERSNFAYSEEEHIEKSVPMDDVPDWRKEPGTGLWEFGKKIEAISIAHTPVTVEISEEINELSKKLAGKETPTFFNGPFANVEAVRFTADNRILINTKETNLFSYLAASYANRDHMGDNPIRPLATQATLFSPDGKKIILEKRSKDLTDFPGKLSVFGGALKPGEDPEHRIVEIVNKKLGLDITPDQVTATGLCRENINNIFCALFAIRLNKDQYEDGERRAKEKMKSKERMFYQASAEEATKSIERILLGKRDITEWDPNAFYNVLYALAANGLRSKEEIEEILRRTRENMRSKPISYTYPIQKHLNID